MRINLSDLAFGAAIAAGGAVVVRQARQLRRETPGPEVHARNAGEPSQRIVVVGMGFAGVAAATRLGELVGGDPRYDVLLIDRHNYHLFYPLLYQVATGGVEPGSLAYPARIIARQHGFRFLQARVNQVDVDRKRLETDVGPLEYTALILAPGSIPK
jgi:NADH dehydrogenase FAD-containing subunit